MNTAEELQYGCKFCWDARRLKEKELFFFDHANNMRICNYCPNCGRPYGYVEEQINANEQ